MHATIHYTWIWIPDGTKSTKCYDQHFNIIKFLSKNSVWPLTSNQCPRHILILTLNYNRYLEDLMKSAFILGFYDFAKFIFILFFFIFIGCFLISDKFHSLKNTTANTNVQNINYIKLKSFRWREFDTVVKHLVFYYFYVCFTLRSCYLETRVRRYLFPEYIRRFRICWLW